MSDSEVITFRVNNEEKKQLDRIMLHKDLKRSKAIKFAIKIVYYSLE